MIVSKLLRVNAENGLQKEIFFGAPDLDTEMEEMYRQRYRVYVNNEYIEEAEGDGSAEMDAYDVEGRCAYFIAKMDGKIIGSVRLIRDNKLPMECFYQFTQPAALTNFSRSEICEISRLVIERPIENFFLPRNIVLLFLIDVLLEYSKENNIKIGYAFLKENLINKLAKLSLPISLIGTHTLIYPKNGRMSNYFYNSENAALPAYFIAEYFHYYLKRRIYDKKMFEKITDTEFFLKSNLYNSFLKMMNII